MTPVGSALPAWPAYRALMGVAVLAGGLIAAVFEATAPTIAANRAAKLASAIGAMLPDVHTWTGYVLDESQQLVGARDETPTIYAVYDAAGALLGFAIRGQVMGYQDRIEAIYGYDPRAETVVGLEILSSRETPGLGSRIATDAAFRANFRALDLALNSSRDALRHPITAVAAGTRQQSWEIDGITGATVSSRAIGKLLNDSAGRVLPALQANLGRFKDG